MRVIRWTLVASVLAVQSPTSAQQASASSASNESAVLPTQLVPLYLSGTRPMAMLTLGEGPPTPVVFDTGTDENLLTDTYVKWLKLKVVGSSAMVDGATGKSSIVPVVGLPEPRLSGASIVPPTAQVFSSGEQDRVGIFGPQSFAGRVVTLELGLKRFRLSPLDPETLPQSAATSHINGVAAANITVAGIPLKAVLDSGATSELTLSRAWMNKVRLKEPAMVIGQAGSVSGKQDLYGGQIDGEVVIGPLRLKDPKVVFIDLMEDANIGYDLLQKLTLVIDPAGKRSWLLDPNVDVGPLTDYAGAYGDYVVRIAGTTLSVQRTSTPLIYKPLGSGLFENAESGNRIQFRRNGGKVLGLSVIRIDGSVTNAERSDRN